jgi:dTDP-D-glucose 4,6-dehydratase
MSNNYNPYEDYDEIIPKDVQQSLNKDYDNVVYGDSMSDEEFADSGCVIVYLFVALILMTLTIIVYYLTH